MGEKKSEGVKIGLERSWVSKGSEENKVVGGKERRIEKRASQWEIGKGQKKM